jgi:hypothetical protein
MFVWPAKRTAALKGENQAAEHRVWNWRNHACRRTPLRGSTPASLPASPPVRRMNPQPQHPIILVFRRLQNPCVYLAHNALPVFSPASASRSKNTISPCNCRAQPPTATSQLIRTCSTIYKTHRLAGGAASLKSLYLQRPSRAPRFDYLP